MAELIEAVIPIREVEGGDDGLMDLLGGPTADPGSGVRHRLQNADDPRIMDPEAGVAHLSDGDRQGDPLREREVNVDVEPLRLEASEVASDGLEFLPDGVKVAGPFLRPKSLRLFETGSLRKKVENFSYCLRKEFLK